MLSVQFPANELDWEYSSTGVVRSSSGTSNVITFEVADNGSVTIIADSPSEIQKIIDHLQAAKAELESAQSELGVDDAR